MFFSGQGETDHVLCLCFSLFLWLYLFHPDDYVGSFSTELSSGLLIHGYKTGNRSRDK